MNIYEVGKLTLPGIKTPEDLKERLFAIYCVDTACPNYRAKWSADNPTCGQCVPTAILVQKLFGGDIYKLESADHYYNIIDGEIIDLTKEQFDIEGIKLNYNLGQKKVGEFDTETLNRYKKLLSKLFVNL